MSLGWCRSVRWWVVEPWVGSLIGGINTFTWRISMAMASVRSCLVRFSSVVQDLRGRCGSVKWGRKDGFTYFDFSKDYILDSLMASSSVSRSRRLDGLLLHRPDALWSRKKWRQLWSLGASWQVHHLGCQSNPMMIIAKNGCQTTTQGQLVALSVA